MIKFQWQIARWSCFIVLGITFQGAVPSLLARQEASTTPEPMPGIAIRVHNYATVPAKTLAHAQAEAGRVLLEAGVTPLWFDCTLNSADPLRYSVWVQHRGLSVIDINLLSDSAAVPIERPGTTLGLTPMSQNGERVALAMIFFNLVKEHATALGPSVAQLLGHAMAHEIRHMLLRTKGHSSEGIMRAKWTPGDLQLAAQGLLLFTAKQAETIRVEVSTRDRMQKASNSADQNLRIPVHVFNYAELSPKTLQRPEAVAAHIFREAGVEANWRNCDP